jgi:pantoate--beta-alanine ligase
MKIVRRPDEMRNLSVSLAKAGRRVALVPTMGALHAGHLSLAAIAREHADVLVMSIFVNPTQFAPGEDLGRYPRPFEQDCQAAHEAGVDFVFAPAVEQMYPADFMTTVRVDEITQKLEGAVRPTHFEGVTSVVCRLFGIVRPHVAVFGQKDAQQVIVIRRMVRDLLLDVDVAVGPIIREPDGLAMSSRNAYLSNRERADAALLYQGLESANQRFEQGERSANALVAQVRQTLQKGAWLETEYVELVDIVRLNPVRGVRGEPVLLAVACRTADSGVRLIDNCILGGVWQ